MTKAINISTFEQLAEYIGGRGITVTASVLNGRWTVSIGRLLGSAPWVHGNGTTFVEALQNAIAHWETAQL